MDKRNNDFDFDFTPIGQAIKKAREKTGMTREQLARIVDYDPRHLQAVENAVSEYRAVHSAYYDVRGIGGRVHIPRERSQKEFYPQTLRRSA